MKPRRQNVTISRRVTRSATILQRNSLSLPDELVFEIFSRLTLKSIARCRCVCKLWSSMLRRQDFTEQFLTKSCARPQLLFACEDDSHEIHFFSSPQPKNPEDNSYVVASDHLARFPGQKSFCVSGFSCYGFNLILNRECKRVICNPSTGQFLNLPGLKPRCRYILESYLGYDPIAKEFKVLSMETSYVSSEWISTNHQVLTLGTNKLSWRLVDCCVPHHSSSKWICISGVLYYTAAAEANSSSSVISMVVCFDLRTEKFSFVKFMEASSKAMPRSTTLVNYDGKLGLLMSGDSVDVTQASKSLELWVLRDAGKNEWSKHVYVLPPSWEDTVSTDMRISGMVGTNQIVLSPIYQHVTSYVIYFNVERKTIIKVGIRGMEAYQGKRFYSYLNYVENVKLL